MKLLIYPDSLHKRWKITQLKAYVETSGVEIVTDPERDFDVVIYWSYHKLVRNLDNTLLSLDKRYDVINIGGWDISKTRNERVMHHAFGYNTLIDPFTYKGKMLEKSEMQGLHTMREVKDVKILKPGYIYVKQIDNRTDDKHVMDYRLYIFDSKVVMVVTKERPIQDRYGGVRESVLKCYTNPEDILSHREQDNITRYCKIYKTSFTELDGVRHNDGKLYIVDNNNVASYNPRMKELFEINNMKILRYLSNYFYETLLKHQN